MHSSLSLPIAGGSVALNLYGSPPGTFTPERARAVAGPLARCTAAALGGERPAPGLPAADRAAALARRKVVRAAEDVVMAASGLPRAEAFHRLALRSAAERRTVADVAAEVLRDAAAGRGR